MWNEERSGFYMYYFIDGLNLHLIYIYINILYSCKKTGAVASEMRL